MASAGDPSTITAQVLLVEDDQSIRESLADIVEAEGYQVTSASNGREALTWLELEASAPAVILLDLMMPAMDGIEFLAQLRALADHAKRATPVIVLTASRHRPSGPGIIASLRKPIDLDALLAALRGALARSA